MVFPSHSGRSVSLTVALTVRVRVSPPSSVLGTFACSSFLSPRRYKNEIEVICTYPPPSDPRWLALST